MQGFFEAMREDRAMGRVSVPAGGDDIGSAGQRAELFRERFPGFASHDDRRSARGGAKMGHVGGQAPKQGVVFTEREVAAHGGDQRDRKAFGGRLGLAHGGQGGSQMRGGAEGDPEQHDPRSISRFSSSARRLCKEDWGGFLFLCAAGPGLGGKGSGIQAGESSSLRKEAIRQARARSASGRPQAGSACSSWRPVFWAVSKDKTAILMGSGRCPGIQDSGKAIFVSWLCGFFDGFSATKIRMARRRYGGFWEGLGQQFAPG